jgi:hypothetical protein
MVLDTFDYMTQRQRVGCRFHGCMGGKRTFDDISRGEEWLRMGRQDKMRLLETGVSGANVVPSGKRVTMKDIRQMGRTRRVVKASIMYA